MLFIIIFTASLRFAGSHTAAMLEPKWKDVNKWKAGRAGRLMALIPSTDDLVIISHISHRRRFCVQLHKRINKHPRRSPAGESEERGAAQSAAVSPVCYGSVSASACVSIYIYVYINAIVCRPDIQNIFTSCRNYNCFSWKSFFPPLSSGWMKYEYVTMAITIFGFCLHAIMRQAFPSSDITTISSLSWPCNPIMDILDALYTHTFQMCALHASDVHGVMTRRLFCCCWKRSFKIRFCYFFSLPLTPSVQTVNTSTCLCKTKRNMPNLGTNVVVLKLECRQIDITCSCALNVCKLVSSLWTVFPNIFRLKQKNNNYFMFVGFKTIHACNWKIDI